MVADEPIGPPPATDPARLCGLVADALSDGDLPAALSYYEADAVVALHGRPVAVGREQVERSLGRLIDARLAIELDLARVLNAGSVALLRADWTAHGVDADGLPFARAGAVVSVARRGSDGAWRIAAEEIRTETLAAGPAAHDDRGDLVGEGGAVCV